MKNMVVMAAVSMMSLISSVHGAGKVEKRKNLPKLELKHSSSKKCPTCKPTCCDPCDAVSGSYYVDSSSQDPLQQIVIQNDSPPQTEPVHFSGKNVECGVTLTCTGNRIVVPKKGIYKIEWNASLSAVNSNYVSYHFDLQKNGVHLLHPIPQVNGNVGTGSYSTPTNSDAASVVVPLWCNDEISLLLTVDGSEGNQSGDGVQVDSAQISATWISPLCD